MASGEELGVDLRRLRPAHLLSAVVAALMALQAALGLAMHDRYLDIAWIKATWFGNDLVTLVGAVPLLGGALVLTRRGSVRGLLTWLGMLGYAVYNYAYYMFGAALNVFFPLYVVLFVLSVVAVILALSNLDPGAVASSFRPRTPVRIVAGYFVFVAVGLAFAWLGMWAAHVFAGAPTPVEPEAFKLVAAMDLSVMVTALGTGGVLLWRRDDWGFVLAPMAGIQAALYLVVLTVNSYVAVVRGITAWPGEIFVWGPMGVLTAAAAVALLAGAGRRDGRRVEP